MRPWALYWHLGRGAQWGALLFAKSIQMAHNGPAPQGIVMPRSLPDELAWHLLETMLLIRRFEENVLRMSPEKHFAGHYHLYTGQEATGAAVMSVLEPRDRLNTTHRNHGHVLARGADPGRAMAEILRRATGLKGGPCGTLHLTARDLVFLSTSGIVGGCISLGVGAGYACKQKRDGSVCAS